MVSLFFLPCYIINCLPVVCSTCRILPLKRAAEEKARVIRAAAASSFKCMLQEKGDIMSSSRWSKVGASVEVLLPVGRYGLFCFSSGISNV